MLNKKLELNKKLTCESGRVYKKNYLLKLLTISTLLLFFILIFNSLHISLNYKNPFGKPKVLGISTAQDINNQIEFIEYTVNTKDTIFSIGQKFEISWQTLATINNLKSPFYMTAGTKIKIPKNIN